VWDVVVLDLAAIFHVDPAVTPWLRVRRLVEALPYEPTSRVRQALRR
jgi:hypothetical protein